MPARARPIRRASRRTRAIALQLRTAIVVAVASALLFAALSPAHAQAPLPPIHYVYDELNRLIAVIDRDNGAARYVYDAAGNIVAIERFDVADIPGPVGITFVAPGKGKIGATVVIYGKGFGSSAAQVSVTFNGTSAAVESLIGNRITTSMPAGWQPLHRAAAASQSTGAYAAVSVGTADPGTLVMQVFEGALRFLARARRAAAPGDQPGLAYAVSRAHAIVAEPSNALDREMGGEVAPSSRPSPTRAPPR
jgi:YD repeat-containing protein